MSELAVGSRVRLQNYDDLYNGAEGVVIRTGGLLGWPWSVVWDGIDQSRDDGYWVHSADELEVIEEKE